jgi:hypothetical protein
MADVDRFGLRLGSKVSKVASLAARKMGGHDARDRRGYRRRQAPNEIQHL